MKLNNKVKTILIYLAFFCVSILFFLSVENNIVAIRFVDEDDNYITGKHLTQDYKLYKDIFSHHQPLPYLVSGFTQTITYPNSLFMLAKRNREMVMLMSFLLGLILVARFRLKGLLFFIVYEFVKIYYFGNLLLAESLSVYATVYIIFFLFSQQKKLKVWEAVLLTLSSFWIVFNLLPMWPFVLITTILFFLQFVHSRKLLALTYLIVGVGCIALLSFFINWPGYVLQTLAYNIKYYIPTTAEVPLILTLFHSLFLPILTLFSFSPSETTYVLKIISIILLASTGLLLAKKKYKLVLTACILLILCNLRYVPIGSQMYQGFHLLPWIAAVISVSLILTENTMRAYKKKYISIIFISLWVVCIALSVFSTSSRHFIKRNKENDLYVNYSRQYDYGKAVNIMKNKNDTLFVMTIEPLIYFEAGTKPALPYLYYYRWMIDTPPIRNDVDRAFKNNPPTFFYHETKDTEYVRYLGKYYRLYKDGQPTPLHVLKSKLISEKALTELAYYHFEIHK